MSFELPLPLQSTSQYREAFAQGLESMLAEYDELGVFILVLANAAFDSSLGKGLFGPLADKFEQLAAGFREGEEGADKLGAPDDVAVFRRLLALGFDNLQSASFRKAGCWDLQFNPLRSFRPPRNAGRVAPGVLQPFDATGFHFAKPFLQKERITFGELFGRPYSLFYNKFPFAPLHALLVPDVEAGLPQYLAPAELEYLWRACEALGDAIPGAAFGYNAYGACSSVNHLHFQFFVSETPLPLESAQWSHNGGSRDYPLVVRVCDSEAQARCVIEELHRSVTSFNLLARAGRWYCVERGRQGEIALPEWTAGLAWYEVSGGFACFNEEDYAGLNEARLAAELARWR